MSLWLLTNLITVFCIIYFLTRVGIFIIPKIFNEEFKILRVIHSNGIRFSITDLSPPTTRIMPTLYQDRVGISLYDAQWRTGEKAPIPESVTKDVVRSLLRFKSTCHDFGVLDSNVRIVATEATRQAINSEDYRGAIEKATGWKVEMLPKEEEGRVGAMGVVSSFSYVKGLMMDLGGGSTQITWLIAENGEVKMSERGSVSMPYGAAALSRRLHEAQNQGASKLEELRREITSNLQNAVKEIQIPKEITNLANTPEGLPLYLSGGGFRGWGFVLMSQHPIQPYPIPIINGFKATTSNFYNIDMVKSAVSGSDNLFRVSERRAAQVPAVALLVTCLLEALPTISTVHFAQGGVREGSIFSSLPPDIKHQHPLITVTLPHSSPSASKLVGYIFKAIPSGDTKSVPSCITNSLLTAFAYSMYIHNSMNKDIQSASALRSTTTGALASVHGADHEDRAMLAIMLCERWCGVGALAPGDESFYRRLMALVGPEVGWWCCYFGRIGAMLGEIYPAGVVSKSKVEMSARWTTGDAKQALEVDVDFGRDAEGTVQSIGVMKALKQVEKIGKKKNWPERKGGHKVLLNARSAGPGGTVDLEADGLELEFA